jgi:toxin ParE1/3/4
MRLRVTRRALSHLSDIRTWIARHRPETAELVRGRIQASLTLLEELPRLGQAGRKQGTRELVVPGLPYVIVYRIDLGDVDEVIILGIFHAARDR